MLRGLGYDRCIGLENHPMKEANWDNSVIGSVRHMGCIHKHINILYIL